ncbi:putative glycolipid-binding domain-containing protein [Bailinhaonella thermotolerans]|uniref:Glycolipid-binding domain-containing protein n=1 Tax=Bailinhaonella thermotolerans TaxID=1070861 RepID=A0A3A4B2D9_9ACTN|nr:putative glycolipid-binding domain-containing protein [Bailinhaonella thermotolerans]RJL32263.1 hypothetical protein D5H75_16630 [Bailinhaonella thermotolerans]
MKRTHTVTWLKDAGAEYAEVRLDARRLTASGLAVGADPEPYRLDYELTTIDGYVTDRLLVRASGSGWLRTLDLCRDPDGSWSCTAHASGTLDGPPPGGDVTTLTGALDCDLGLSPLTNTMPVLRHELLTSKRSIGFTMAWVAVPHLAVVPATQRYAHLDTNLIRFTQDDFTADIVFGPDALVADYPGIARRA